MGSSWTMVASLVALPLPTSVPTSTRWLLTTPSNGASNVRIAEIDLGEFDRRLGAQHLRRGRNPDWPSTAALSTGWRNPAGRAPLAGYIRPCCTRVSPGWRPASRSPGRAAVGIGRARCRTAAFPWLRCAVFIVDRFEIPLNARDEVDGVERLSIAGQLEIEGHRPLHRLRHLHLGRRRRDIGVLAVAACERDRAHATMAARTAGRSEERGGRVNMRTRILEASEQ